MNPSPPRWIVTAQADPDATRVLASELRIPDALAAILVQRGLGSAELAKAFLRPDLERLSDPHRWADMEVALELLGRAVREKRTILVHGDYDVDGQCASAMLTRILRSAGFVANERGDEITHKKPHYCRCYCNRPLGRSTAEAPSTPSNSNFPNLLTGCKGLEFITVNA